MSYEKIVRESQRGFVDRFPIRDQSPAKKMAFSVRIQELSRQEPSVMMSKYKMLAIQSRMICLSRNSRT